MAELLLGVNIDHIATLRNARGTAYPDPVQAAFIAEQAGADGITVHLREDRRHITDRDVRILRQTLDTRMNLEMAVTEEMLAIACETQPHFCCLVPEKRQEVTTEGGLDVAGQLDKMRDACKRLADAGILVSLFIDADFAQIKAAADVGAPYIEIHTGCYADAKNDAEQAKELERIAKAATYASSLGLKVNAGHGLTYHNVKAIAALPEMHELNIGHAIIGRAVMSGLKEAVSEMKRLMQEAPAGALSGKALCGKRGGGQAFGTGIRNGLAFNQFEVFNDELGKPSLRLWGEAQKLAKKLGVNHMHDKLIPELLFALDVGRILQDGIRDRAHFLTGRRFIVADAFRAAVAVNLIDAVAHRNRLVRAFGLAHIAINAFFGN
ncbi:hypothetical protein L1887_46587 [Cichorium endivia]|nr:hypothetical protein L1887_46587 [Cichorium endivia]